MGWYRSPEWGEVLRTLDDWWQEAISLCTESGSLPENAMSRGFGSWTYKIAFWCDDAGTGINPAPFWRLYIALRRYYPGNRVGGDDPGGRPSPKRLMLLLDRVWLDVERLRHMGVVDDKPADSLVESPKLDQEVFEGLLPRSLVVERLSEAERTVYLVVSQSDVRLTRDEVIAAIQHGQGDHAPGESAIASALSWMTKVGLLSSVSRGKGDQHGHGYGRADWGVPAGNSTY